MAGGGTPESGTLRGSVGRPRPGPGHSRSAPTGRRTVGGRGDGSGQDSYRVDPPGE
jgi:hypothetical protein